MIVMFMNENNMLARTKSMQVVSLVGAVKDEVCPSTDLMIQSSGKMDDCRLRLLRGELRMTFNIYDIRT
jgi:hypothetical protein